MGLSDIHRQPANRPLGYFITVRTYGTWMHGDARGSVSRQQNTFNTPRIAPNPDLEKVSESRLLHEPVVVGSTAVALIENTVREVCAHRIWHLWAVKMRTNHLHVVVTANHSAERVLADIKAWCTRRLREHNFIAPAHTAWARHGSTPHLWTPGELEGAIDYVLNRQGGPLREP